MKTETLDGMKYNILTGNEMETLGHWDGQNACICPICLCLTRIETYESEEQKCSKCGALFIEEELEIDPTTKKCTCGGTVNSESINRNMGKAFNFRTETDIYSECDECGNKSTKVIFEEKEEMKT